MRLRIVNIDDVVVIMRLRKLTVELDSLLVYNSVQNTSWVNHKCIHFIDRAKELIRRPWTMKLNYMFWEGNKLADTLQI